jgi:anti-sigma-K factor RskA
MTKGRHVEELLPGYALGALDDSERGEVEAHLAVCGHCAAELRTYRNVSDYLARSVPMVEPPERLKAAILKRVQGRKPMPAAPRLSWVERVRAAFMRTAPVWGVVSLALVIILAVSNLLLWRQMQQIQQASSRFTTVALAGTDAAPGAIGMIVISHDGRYGTLIVDHLPPLKQDKQYQLWLINGEKRTSGGVFNVDQNGYGSVWITSPGPLIQFQSFGITIEPAGGSPGPTGQKVLGGSS